MALLIIAAIAVLVTLVWLAFEIARAPKETFPGQYGPKDDDGWKDYDTMEG